MNDGSKEEHVVLKSCDGAIVGTPFRAGNASEARSIHVAQETLWAPLGVAKK